MFTRAGDAYVMDWNNHRVISFDDNDELVVLTGIGGNLGDGPEGDASQEISSVKMHV